MYPETNGGSMSKKITADDFDFTYQVSNEPSLPGQASDYEFLNTILYNFAVENEQKATLKKDLHTIGSGPNWMRFLQRDGKWWVLFNAQQWGWMGGTERVTICADGDLSELLEEIHTRLAFDNILK